MEYLVFLIYGIVVSEWIFSSKVEDKNTSSYRGSYGGREYYKTLGITNIVVGNVGMFLFNYFFRDKGIIPVWSFWVGLVGFVIILFSGCIYMVKMFTTEQP